MLLKFTQIKGDFTTKTTSNTATTTAVQVVLAPQVPLLVVVV